MDITKFPEMIEFPATHEEFEENRRIIKRIPELLAIARLGLELADRVWSLSRSTSYGREDLLEVPRLDLEAIRSKARELRAKAQEEK